ncbi:MAG: hypothetical protein AW08_03058 [Candidatus Accumulibacter adjunctus]|uniref:Uncharacterized protein n=1 Tax=Candidatus Accumulibacter adjunctus TaxID=1454001 RepID=A0A011M7C2_9PROT|nr:MAG: hypothetical protein AW08_03058 [Candidatus Accumulibacter adjunctus]
MQLEIGPHVAARLQEQALAGDAVGGELAGQLLGASIRAHRGEQHPRPRQRAQQLAPQGNDRRTDLRRSIEAAEGEVAAGERRQRTDGWCIGERQKGRARRQADDRFGELLVELADRQKEPVSEEIVDRLQAGGSGVANPARLYRCRLVGEGGQAVMCGVPAKVDQDVDAVGTDPPRQVGVTQVGHRLPVGEVPAQALRDMVLLRMVVVGMQRQAGVAGQLDENRLDEAGDGVVAEIGGDQTDVQAAVGITPVVVRLAAVAQRCLDHFAEVSVRSEQCCGVDRLMVTERIEEVAVRQERIGFELDRLPQRGIGFGVASECGEDNAQIEVCVCEIGCEGNCRAITCFGFVESICLVEDVAQVVMRCGEVRAAGNRSPQACFGVVEPIPCAPGCREDDHRLGEVGLAGDRRLPGAFRLLRSLLLLQVVAEIVVGGGEIRLVQQCLPQCRLTLAKPPLNGQGFAEVAAGLGVIRP